MKKLKINVGSKFPLYILIVCLISFAVLGITSYITVGSLLTDQCKKDAMEFAQFAANELDGDAFLSISSENDEAYSDVYNSLTKYRNSQLVSYIYAMRIDDGVLRFIVDTDPDDPADYGEEYELLDDMLPAFDGIVCCDKDISTDEWGSYYSAYAPIRTSEGIVAGIVGCDIEMSSVAAIKANLRNIIITVLSLMFVVYVIIYSRLSNLMMNIDLLTDLSNYDGLIEKGSRLKKSKKLSDFTAVLINIKDFKYLNQKNGANTGDIVLKYYSRHLKRSVKKNEFIARTGSDNFLVLVMKGREENFLDSLRNVKIQINDNSQPTPVYARCGIYPISENDTIKEIMNSASVALKESRLPSSPDFVRFKSDMVSSMVEEKKILNDYKRAINEHEFTAYYQPKVNTDTYTLCGAEALVRWVKDGTIIPPFKFIPVLEKEHRIAELDFYVFDLVCSNIADWISRGITPCRISSNFSKVHLADPKFAERVIETVNKHGIDPKYVEIELTESSGYSDFNALTQFVAAMNNANIYTSIDDFGTGYSSLSLLKDINVDVVKIDKSFLDKSKKDDVLQEKMLGNIIRMINDLDRTVICEGVENKEQLTFLKNAECSIIQGYYFDKPLPHDEFEKRLISPSYK